MKRIDQQTSFMWTRFFIFCKCTLYLCILSLGLGTANTDSGVFLIYIDELHGCLETMDTALRLSRSCNESNPAQQWIWVSRRRLFNLGSTQCLGLSGTNTGSLELGMYKCDREYYMVWNCNSLGEKISQHISPGNTSLSPSDRGDQARDSQWRVYGTNQDLCSKPYHEIYTIQGNSYGKPCTTPFKYDNQWFHECTSTGREDGHLWCATTADYGKDERWGFCPVKSPGCETFWDKDPMTNSCYQFNFQSMLSWSEARVSCQQQGADLLSINEIHEQTYINGLLTGYSSSLWIGLNDLDINGGWQWSDASPLKYLNWEADQPDNSEEESCGVIRTETSGRWQNKNCDMALPYVCKKKPNTAPNTTTAETYQRMACDGAWEQFQSSCYLRNSEKMSWQEARQACHKMEADLVSIHTLLELEFVVKSMKREPAKSHKWSSSGECPHSLKDSSWVPFRDSCYSFHLESRTTPTEAAKKCRGVGATVLSIMDETENLFVWEHIQDYEWQSSWAWLGMTFNPKEGSLVWPDSSVVEYSNWGQQDSHHSMLSPNTCFWVQSNNGVWGLGSCTNVTRGIICKMPRVIDTSYSKSSVQDNTTVIVVVVMATVALCLFMAAIIYLYRKRAGRGREAFESARYSRTTSTPTEAAKKNILVSDMEMNEQPE